MEVLKRVAADIKAVMSLFEYARQGGEEFAIYLAGVRRGDVEALGVVSSGPWTTDPTLDDHQHWPGLGVSRPMKRCMSQNIRGRIGIPFISEICFDCLAVFASRLAPTPDLRRSQNSL
nr:hypothetical protein [Pseudomonas sp. PD9R]